MRDTITKPSIVNREGEEIELNLGVGAHPYRPFGSHWKYSSEVFFVSRWRLKVSGRVVELDPSPDFPGAECFSFYPSPDGRYMTVIAFYP